MTIFQLRTGINKLRRKKVGGTLAFVYHRVLSCLVKYCPNTALTHLYLNTPNDTVINNIYNDYQAKSFMGDVSNFHFDSVERDKIINLIPIAMREKTLGEAEGFMSYRFHFKSISQTFVDRIDWFLEPGTDKSWRWDLNHHSFLLTLARAYLYTNNPKYINRIYEVVVDWRKRNPLDCDQPNWNEPFEVAARLNNWMWLFFLIKETKEASPLLLKILLKGIYQHGSYLFQFMEIHSPNNHLLLEAKVLFEASLMFPLPRANKWRKKACHYFLREFMRQVEDDGGHSEQSTTYHRIINSEVLEIYSLALRNADSKVTSLLEAPLIAMTDFAYSMMRPDGSFPVIGDATSVDTHYRFNPFMIAATVFDDAKYKGAAIAMGEEDLTFFVLGPDGIETYNRLVSRSSLARSVCFPYSGYYIMQDESVGLKAVIDCGPFCDDKIPAHGHDDILSFELSLNNSLLIIDGGNDGLPDDAPEANNWREYFRGARAHNVLVLNHSNRSHLRGFRDVLRVAKPIVSEWHTDENVDYFAGAHDGYINSFGVIHQREIVLVKGHFLCVLDRLIGKGDHQVRLLYHLAPGKEAVFNGQAVDVLNAHEPFAQITFFGILGDIAISRGDMNPIQGWLSPESGCHIQADTVSFSARAEVPLCIGTIIQIHKQEMFKIESVRFVSATSRCPTFDFVLSGPDADYEFSASSQVSRADPRNWTFRGPFILGRRTLGGRHETIFNRE